MRRQLTVILLSALMLNGCASGRMGNPGAIVGGAATGGSLGSSIDGLIGDDNRGWRGRYRGSAIGNIVGTTAGAAIGNALTTSKPDPIEEYVYAPEVRQGQSHSKFKSRTQTQQQLTQSKLRRVRFIDNNRNHAIDGGESGKIIFKIMDEGRNPVYDVIPIVETVGKVKHIGISPTIVIEKILPGGGIRYTAVVYAGSELKDGEATFRVAVPGENGVICDSQEFTLPTQRAE